MLKVMLPTRDPSLACDAGHRKGDRFVHRYNATITAEIIGFSREHDGTISIWLKVDGHDLPVTSVYNLATLEREYQKASQ